MNLLFTLLGLFLLPIAAANAALEVSMKNSCFGTGTEQYHISQSNQRADYSVKVSATAYPFDLSLKLVEDINDADLIVVDEKPGDMSVCKKRNAYGVTSLMVSNAIYDPDITVKLSKYAYSVDYKVFVKSERMLPREAAAIFAVMWTKDKVAFDAQVKKAKY